MFIAFLRLSSNREKFSELVNAHNAWIEEGMQSGVFLMVGILQPKQGGFILAHETTLPELEKRIQEDPFVKEGVVKPEILEISPARVDQRLEFLLHA